jgi:ribose transport system ATP-binding protein
VSSDSPRLTDEDAPQRVGPAVLCIDRVFKRFGGTQALNDVSMSVGRGEIVALLGENGAGKSTLIKILAGVHAVDAGTVCYEGNDMTSAVRRMPISIG